MKRYSKTVGSVLAYALALSCGGEPVAANAASQFGPFKHVVVIYEENHSFDNLYGGWNSVNGEPVNGRAVAPLAKTTQLRQDGTAYGCLLQNDVNLASPPLTATCSDTGGATPINSAFDNEPFAITNYIAPTDTTCPDPTVFAAHGVLKGAGEIGGCTEDIVHRYYQEQYQINNGAQNRYVTGSDAAGLSMGYYDTTQLPIYQYLQSDGAPNYVLADNFFQAAFGGSFLNHQWLVAAQTPTFRNAVNDGGSTDLHSIVDDNGMPNNYPLYTSTHAVKDAQLTESCNPPVGQPAPPAGTSCGDFAINTIQPTYQPYSPGTLTYKRLPPLNNANIGDRLSAAHVTWAWYSGGWSNADGDVGAPGWTNGSWKKGACSDPETLAGAVFPNCPHALFQFHHQALNYYKTFAPGTAERYVHLRDEAEFIKRAQAGTLPQVSFVKPLGTENEHPGYSSETNGNSHLVTLVNDIINGPDGDSTLVIVTYDEFGGQWDHVSPPGSPGAKGAHDKWGPGTRIPALLISKKFKQSTVDHTAHDTTTILATLETMFGLQPLGARDATVGSFFDPAVTQALSK